MTIEILRAYIATLTTQRTALAKELGGIGSGDREHEVLSAIHYHIDSLIDKYNYIIQVMSDT